MEDYKDVELVHGEGYNYLVKDYGPCHILNPIWTIILGIILVGCIVYSYKNSGSIAYKMFRVSSVIVLVPFSLYIIEKIFSLDLQS